MEQPKREARTGLAFWLESDNQKACEIARLAGFDIVIFDMEHGILDEPALDRLVPYCSGLGLTTYVRVSEATQPQIQIALDIGAHGVICRKFETSLTPVQSRALPSTHHWACVAWATAEPWPMPAQTRPLWRARTASGSVMS